VALNREYHRWPSTRLGREMGVAVYGHWGAPLLVFPTSGGDEWEYERQGMVDALAAHLEAGRVKVFCAGSVNDASWYDKLASPAQRVRVQASFDAYVASELVPFIHDHCRTPGIAIATAGSSFGAYHAVNSLLKHPKLFHRCFGLSGIYDLRRFMDGHYDDTFYFNNPVDYAANLADPALLDALRSCDIHLVTGSGPWEDSGPTRQLAAVLAARGIPHSLDDWGPEGGHDWAYWKRQTDAYLRQFF
jgi:esterase/lipase superfamily enzyme